MGPVRPGKGARLVVAPRVLVDATAVPADRGALGRYVDGLVAALCEAGADLAVACQRADEERYGRLVPDAQNVAGPTAITHRPARQALRRILGNPGAAQERASTDHRLGSRHGGHARPARAGAWRRQWLER